MSIQRRLRVPLSYPRVIAVGLVVVGLVIAILGGLVQRRADVADLISLKEEGTALLNRDPMTFLKRAIRRTPSRRSRYSRSPSLGGFEDALPRLRRAGATDGEVSHFTTIITYAPAAPAMSEDHAAVKGILATRLQRLQPIITRLEGARRRVSARGARSSDRDPRLRLLVPAELAYCAAATGA